jgi:hypothetical protein
MQGADIDVIASNANAHCEFLSPSVSDSAVCHFVDRGLPNVCRPISDLFPQHRTQQQENKRRTSLRRDRLSECSYTYGSGCPSISIIHEKGHSYLVLYIGLIW